MRHLLLWCSLMAAVISCAVPAALGAQDQPASPSKKPKVIYITPKKHFSPQDLATISNQAAASQTIPLWNYSVTGYDGKNYQGKLVGRAPYAHGHRSTTIPTFVVPVKLIFPDGTPFDPTVADPCSPNGDSVLNLVKQSPIFQNADFIMNGFDVGTTQYLDAFERGNFWSYVRGTPYHTVFASNPTVLSAVTVMVPAGKGSTQPGFLCGSYGQMDIDWWDTYLETTIIPSLASKGVGPANFPQFIFDSVVMYLNGDPTQCCALGYHSSYSNGGIFQTYSANDFDTSGAFGGDTSVMSHEVAEWMDDPNGSNPVPVWGAEGQQPACQNNLEVGDPLSPGFSTPTNPFSILMPNGVAYTLQELAYFSWFYGEVPSFGSGGGYSDNGTFLGHAIACPPGGTH